MLIVFGIFGLYVLYVNLTEDDANKEFKHLDQTEINTEKTDDPNIQPETPAITHNYLETNKEEYRIIQEEIYSAIQKHTRAITVLQSLARIDGSTSEPEKNLIFTFLQRNGENLSFARHRRYFYGFCSGEWQRPVPLDEFKNFLDELNDCEREYKNDVYYTAIAIIACGGEPKKREAECLSLLNNIVSK